MKSSTIYFQTVGDERIEITYDDMNAIVHCNGFCIDNQQLGELGILFLTLAGEFDVDSGIELLDGYGELTKENVKSLFDSTTGIRNILEYPCDYPIKE